MLGKYQYCEPLKQPQHCHMSSSLVFKPQPKPKRTAPRNTPRLFLAPLYYVYDMCLTLTDFGLQLAGLSCCCCCCFCWLDLIDLTALKSPSLTRCRLLEARFAISPKSLKLYTPQCILYVCMYMKKTG